MTKAKRQLQEKLKSIDMVIEVLDARLPFGSQNTDFENLFLNKKRFYILNKCDLADDRITAKWIAYFQSKGIPVRKFSAHSGSASQLLDVLVEYSKEITEKYAQKGINKTVRALVAGIPNVGKSAILNRLSGSKKAKEGNKPGVTKGLQWVKITPYFEIMDTPGLLMPKIEDDETAAKIAFIGSIKQEILDEENLAYHLIRMLKNTSPELLVERYKLDELKENAYDVLGDICKKRGFLLKGGEFDYERGARTVLEEFKNGKMGKISLEQP